MGWPWLVFLTPIFCHKPSQEAGTGQAGGAQTAPDTGLLGKS